MQKQDNSENLYYSNQISKKEGKMWLYECQNVMPKVQVTTSTTQYLHTHIYNIYIFNASKGSQEKTNSKFLPITD